MARISGVDIPRDKRVVIALTYIHGIGRSSAAKIVNRCGIDIARRVADLTEEETTRIRALIESDYVVEGVLRTETQMNVKRLMDIGCYRGLRHRRGLPVRGQRTRTNSRTRKGRRRTVAGRAAAPKK